MPALTIENGPLAGRRLEVARSLTFGRDQDVDVVIDDPTISRRHARVRPADGGLEIDDLGSRNGTWVNGARIEATRRLAPGDVVEVGGVFLVVETERLAATVVRRRVLPQWQSFTGSRVAVHAPEGSYAERRAEAEMQEAERAVAMLEDLLAPPAEAGGERVDVYLIEAGAPVEAPEGAIARGVQPEAPGAPIAYPLTRLLVGRWYGEAAESLELFVDGVAGLVAGRLGAGPTLEQADDAVREELASGGAVSIFVSGEAPNPAAISFVGFLLGAFGPEALRAFLAAWDPERRDQAATEVYQRPLGALEEAWLANLRQLTGMRATFRALMGHLVPLMRPHARRWAEIFVYMVLGVGYAIAIPLAFKYLFDTVIPRGELQRLWIFTGVLFAIFVVNVLVTMRRSYVTAMVSQRVLFGLQERMFEHLQRLSHDFYGRAKVGDLMARLSADLNIVQEATTAVLAEGVFLSLSALAAAITAVVLSPLLGALVLLVVPLFVLSYLALLGRVRRAGFEVQTIYGSMVASIQENLSAHSLVKALGLERRAIDTYRGRLGVLLQTLARVVMLSSLFEASVGFAVTLGELVVIGLGGYLVIEGHVSVGTLVAFVALMPTFFQPITALANVGQRVQEAAGAFDRMLEILQEPVSVAEREDAGALPPLSREIRVERVEFGYEPERPILGGLDMTIPAGGHVAIVGPSGSGKSTIVNLLLRFWDPDSGRVLFDGVDVRDVTLASLRGQIGLVFQDTFVFDTSVRENVALAREGATDADVARAVEAARLSDWVESLPAGLDTVLGERGVRMSGGQRQRLAIARALVRDPAVLILDEATSALDARTEAEILETLDEASRGRTTISITHRLSLSARADEVFVLEGGEVVERGTHAELVRAGGPYARLYDEQMAHVAAGERLVGIGAARLGTVPLFGGLASGSLADLAGRLRSESFGAGDVVVRQGDEASRLYVVASGQLELVAGDPEWQVNVLNQGDFFGEAALIGEERWTATARATMPTEVLSLERADFEALVERDAALGEAVQEQVVARRLAAAQASRRGSAVRSA